MSSHVHRARLNMLSVLHREGPMSLPQLAQRLGLTQYAAGVVANHKWFAWASHSEKTLGLSEEGRSVAQHADEVSRQTDESAG